MAEDDELPVQHGAGTQAAEKNGHPSLALRIAARLRAITLRHVNDRPGGRTRKMPLLRNAHEIVEAREQILLLRLGGELHGDRHGVTIRDRKSTRLNSSHLVISYAVFCLKK